MRHTQFAAVIVAVWSVVAAGPQAQTAADAKVVAVQVTGDPTTRFNLVVLADGYTAADMPKFREQLDKHLNIMWSIEPFRSYRNYFNVYAVEAISEHSGITCDPALLEEPNMNPELRRTLQQRNTAFGTNFGGGCTNINARGVTVPQALQAKVREYATRAAATVDQILILSNSRTYGGIGGSLATSTGGNALSPLITPHELGHSLGGLTDEYTYSARGRAGGTYSGNEPNSIHTTILTVEEMKAQQKKWWRWLGEPSESGGLIDRFEGASGNTKGIWRPSKHSMMISLGYFFDQVSRERMTQRIAERTGMIAGSTPTDIPVKSSGVIWIDPAHPVYHSLEIEWKVDDRAVASARNQPMLDLKTLSLPAGPHTASVTVVDSTEFVRDPVIRERALTATRTWTIAPVDTSLTTTERRQAVLRDQGLASDPRNPARVLFVPKIGAATQTLRPIGGTDVVYIELTRPDPTIVDPMIAQQVINWTLNGQAVLDARGALSFPLAPRNLRPGPHTLRVWVTPTAGRPLEERVWRIDNTPATVTHTLSTPVANIAATATTEPHAFMRDEFTMKLDPADDQPGYLVAEFRLNGDGWHHYYGWPDAPPGTPFKFTARGTNIKELIYGSLSSEGLSPQPWEPREPGWGSHRIEYRGKDAAGNIGPAKAFRVTVMPAPACTRTIGPSTSGQAAAITVEGGAVVCLDRADQRGSVTVQAGGTLIATNSKITGPVTSTGATRIELVSTTVTGTVTISGTTDSVVMFGSTTTGAVTVSDNKTARPAALIGNTFGGALACAGNSIAPVNGGTPNTLKAGATGQCSGSSSR